MNIFDELTNSSIKDDEKICRECKCCLPLDSFNKDKSKEKGVSNQCKECYSVYHIKNRDKINARRVVNRKRDNYRNPNYHKEWYRANKDKVRNKHYMAKYGISLATFEALVESQNGQCKICKAELSISKRKPHVDHCHKTGRLRGILCHTCNTKLGWVEKHFNQVLKYTGEN